MKKSTVLHFFQSVTDAKARLLLLDRMTDPLDEVSSLAEAIRVGIRPWEETPEGRMYWARLETVLLDYPDSKPELKPISLHMYQRWPLSIDSEYQHLRKNTSKEALETYAFNPEHAMHLLLDSIPASVPRVRHWTYYFYVLEHQDDPDEETMASMEELRRDSRQYPGSVSATRRPGPPVNSVGQLRIIFYGIRAFTTMDAVRYMERFAKFLRTNPELSSASLMDSSLDRYAVAELLE